MYLGRQGLAANNDDGVSLQIVGCLDGYHDKADLGGHSAAFGGWVVVGGGGWVVQTSQH